MASTNQAVDGSLLNVAVDVPDIALDDAEAGSCDDQLSHQLSKDASNKDNHSTLAPTVVAAAGRAASLHGSEGHGNMADKRSPFRLTFNDTLYRPSYSLVAGLGGGSTYDESVTESFVGAAPAEPYRRVSAHVEKVSKSVWDHYLLLATAAAKPPRSKNSDLARRTAPIISRPSVPAPGAAGSKASLPRLATVSEHLEHLPRHALEGVSLCITDSQAPRSPKPTSVFGLPMLPPNCRLALTWSVVMLVMDAVYVAFVMPLNAGFCPLLPGELTWCSAIDLGAGVVFLVNLMLSFHIGIIISCDFKQRTLMDGKVVARYYVRRGKFWIDAISVLPLIYQVIVLIIGVHDYWVNRAISFVQLVRLLRLVHLLRVLYIDSVVNVSHSVGGIMPMAGMLALVMAYSAAVLLNFLTCLTWLVIHLEGIEHSLMAEPLGHIDVVNGNMPLQYVVGLYWVLTTVTGTGYGDLHPVTVPEVCLAMVFMLSGITMFALLISSMAELLTAATATARQAHDFREKMQKVNEWMNKRNIPRKLQRQVAAYYSQAWLHHTEHSEEALIFQELPHFLRAHVACHITTNMLSGDNAIPALAALEPDAKEALSSRLEPVEVLPGHVLCREGDAADCVWLFQDGDMLALRNGRPVEVVTAPCLLGESVLLADDIPAFSVRPCTFRAMSICHLWHLSSKDLQRLFYLYPYMRAQLFEGSRANMLARLVQHNRGLVSRSSTLSDDGAKAMQDALEALGSAASNVPVEQQWRQRQRQHHWQHHHRPFSELYLLLERLPQGGDGINREELLKKMREAIAGEPMKQC